MFGMVPFGKNHFRKQEFLDLQKLFDSFWDEGRMFGGLTSMGSFRTDIRETEKEYILEAELPGVAKEEIRMQITDHLLSISLQKEDEKTEQQDNYIRRERNVGNLCRSFRLEGIREEAIEATYKDGILKITLPKDESKKEKARNIDIQ